MAKRHRTGKGDLESVFLRLEELVLASSGEDEVEEIFKLVVAKLRDERSGGSRFGRQTSPEATSQAIRDLLGEAEREWPGILDPGARPRLTNEHLAVCVELLSRHRLTSAAFEVMDGFFEFLVARQAKGAKGQFFTPRHVIELCVRMVGPRPGETVADPACGSGGFLLHALQRVRSASSLWGFDIDPTAIRVAKALMVLAGDGSGNLVRLNSLLKGEIEEAAHPVFAKAKGFDVVLTNPPFAGEVREPAFLEAYTLARGRSRIERDVLFVERCLDLLRPGGRMAIVLPHNTLGADSYAYVRRHVVGRARVVGVVGLGRNTFLPHTHQKAGVLFLQKHGPGLPAPSRASRIFFGISERDGKDSKGGYVERGTGESLWDRVDHDLGEIVQRFGQFCRDEGLF